tara:strand:- start:224 stop:370 length:147 start_codon:yes stop_codon:yes gene_type:complete
VAEADQLILEHPQDQQDQVVAELAVKEDNLEHFLNLDKLIPVVAEVQI